MLDLNLSFVHEDMMTDFRDESGSSSSSVLNTEHCNSNNAGNGDGDGVGDGDSFHCFNFDILNVGDTGVSEDRASQTQVPTQSQFMTRSLFPMCQMNSSLLLFPDNNSKFQDMELVQVQQEKPIVQQQQNQVTVKKSRRGPRSRSSQYRGVTFYRRTGRWESHIWDCGKQVYLGGFDTAHAAARAYDRAAVKFRGVDADINFNITDYEEDMNQIKNLSKEDFVHLLRRHSNGFSRGKSKYGGVVIDKSGRWEAQMGQFIDKKVYDNTTIKSNFEAGTYERETFASHSGNGDNLDLNLGISTPSCLGKGLSRHLNLSHMQMNHGCHDIRRLQMENHAAMALKGRPIISEHDQPWTGMYPTFFPSYEVGATNTRIIGGSSQGPSNWAWQLHGQSHPKLTTLFTAASSGFPTPAATAHISTTTATNSPDYHYLMRPPPSPPPAPPPTP